MKRQLLHIAKRGVVSMHYPLTFIWKNIDKSLSWPDFWPVFEKTPLKLFGGIGGDSYTGWVYQQGFFASLLRISAEKSTDNTVLDFGCGLGKIVYPSSALLGENGKYIGVDIIERVIQQARRLHRTDEKAAFFLSKDFNLRYNTQNKQTNFGQDWPVQDGSVDIVTALSVFTHLQEVDTLGYLAKIHRVLKPGGVAVLTFHILNEPGQINIPRYRSPWMPFLETLFSFEHPLSDGWYTSDPELPETVIGITEEKLQEIVKGRFTIRYRFHGSTTGGEDLFPQDILVLKKCGS